MAEDNENIEPVIITHRFNASRELVFRMWSKPEYLERWYAPRQCRLRIHDFDFRVGGRIRTTISGPDGSECHCAGVFREIVPPQRIVYTMYFCDEECRLVPPQAVGMDAQWPDETVVTVTFEEDPAEHTLMTLHQTVPETLARSTGAYAGWIEMFDRLEENLEVAGQ